MSRDLVGPLVQILSQISHAEDSAALHAGIADLETRADEILPPAEARALRQCIDAVRSSAERSVSTERALNLLVDTTHDLSSTLELPELLKMIVSRAKTLSGANIVWVTADDKESGMFQAVTAEGYLSPATAVMKSDREYGVVGLIMKSKSYFVTQDYLNDHRFPHLATLDRAFENENIKSLAGFPMLADGEVHGCLFVADRFSRTLSGPEISVLGSFALHAGVAIRNANAFRLLSEALAEGERNRKALVDYIQRVEASAAAHDEMTSLLASGAEVQHFLHRMAKQIDGAVFLIDDELRIRAESVSANYDGQIAATLKSGRIDPVQLIAARSKSRHTGRSVEVLHAGDEYCRSVTLHGGAEPVESIVVCRRGELDAIEIRNLERNVVALSIAKLWNEKREAESLIASSTILRHLILVAPPDPATVSAVRDRLNLGADQAVMLALIAVSGLDRAAQTAVIRKCATGLNVLVDLLDDTYLAIGPEAQLRLFLQRLARSRKGWEAGGILSDSFVDLASSSAQFVRMNKALQILRRMARIDRFVEQREVNLFAKLFEAGDAARVARYMNELLTPIEEHSPRQRAQLKRTLLCYFDRQHNIRRVADELGLHVNTVRQRLDTLCEITGGWDDPVRALELHIALRLDAISNASPPVVLDQRSQPHRRGAQAGANAAG